MNILLVSSLFPNSLEPLRGIFTFQIAKEMWTYENVRVIAPVPVMGNFKFLNLLRKYKVRSDIPFCDNIDGNLVYHPQYTAVPGAGILHHVAMYRALRPLMSTILKDWHIDAVNCHWIFPDGAAVRKICAELGIPVMLTPLGTDLNRYAEFPLRRQVIKSALRKSDKVSVLNREMFGKCLNLGVSKERLAIIPNGVDLEEFFILDRKAARAGLGVAADSQTILFVGTLVPVKGVEILLRAFDLMRRKRRTGSLELFIVGAGHLGDSLKKLSAKLGWDGAIHFVGPVMHSDLVHWLNAADCLCLPSLTEGHPNVMMEALACGTPIVASPVGSVPDFVTEATGRLARPLDHVDLAAKLEQCLARAYDREAIRGSVQDFSWRECAQRYVSELHGLIEKRRGETPHPSKEKADV